MASSKAIRSEIDGLRSDLAAGAGPHPEAAQSRPTESHLWTEAEEKLRDLHTHLLDTAEHGEEFVADHPLAALLAAFMLGLAAGSLTGRAR